MNLKSKSVRRVSDSYKADSYDYKGYTINIYYDDDFNPFVDYDVMPTVYTTEPIFDFAEEINEDLYSKEDVEEYFKDYYYLPFYVNLETSQPSAWNCSDKPEKANGFLVWKKGQYEEETGSSVDPYESLKNDLKLFNEWVQGEVYAYEVENPDGDVISDWVGGYVGWEARKEMEAEAESIVDADIEEQEKIAAEEAAEEEEWERGREDREFDEFWDKRGDIGDSAKNKVSDSFNSDLCDAINVELMGLADGIEVSECNENRVLIETTSKLYSRFKDDIKDIMLDFDYAYNKSYPMKDKWIIDFRG